MKRNLNQKQVQTIDQLKSIDGKSQKRNPYSSAGKESEEMKYNASYFPKNYENKSMKIYSSELQNKTSPYEQYKSIKNRGVLNLDEHGHKNVIIDTDSENNSLSDKEGKKQKKTNKGTAKLLPNRIEHAQLDSKKSKNSDLKYFGKSKISKYVMKNLTPYKAGDIFSRNQNLINTQKIPYIENYSIKLPGSLGKKRETPLSTSLNKHSDPHSPNFVITDKNKAKVILSTDSKISTGKRFDSGYNTGDRSKDLLNSRKNADLYISPKDKNNNFNKEDSSSPNIPLYVPNYMTNVKTVNYNYSSSPTNPLLNNENIKTYNTNNNISSVNPQMFYTTTSLFDDDQSPLDTIEPLNYGEKYYQSGGKVDLDQYNYAGNRKYRIEELKKKYKIGVYEMRLIIKLQLAIKKTINYNEKKIVDIQRIWRGYWLRKAVYYELIKYYKGSALIDHILTFMTLLMKRYFKEISLNLSKKKKFLNKANESDYKFKKTYKENFQNDNLKICKNERITYKGLQLDDYYQMITKKLTGRAKRDKEYAKLFRQLMDQVEEFKSKKFNDKFLKIQSNSELIGKEIEKLKSSKKRTSNTIEKKDKKDLTVNRYLIEEDDIIYNRIQNSFLSIKPSKKVEDFMIKSKKVIYKSDFNNPNIKPSKKVENFVIKSLKLIKEEEEQKNLRYGRKTRSKITTTKEEVIEKNLIFDNKKLFISPLKDLRFNLILKSNKLKFFDNLKLGKFKPFTLEAEKIIRNFDLDNLKFVKKVSNIFIKETPKLGPIIFNDEKLNIIKDKKLRFKIEGLTYEPLREFILDEILPIKKVNDIFIKPTPLKKKIIVKFEKEKLNIFKDNRNKFLIKGELEKIRNFILDDIQPQKNVNSLFIKETPKKEVKIFQKDKLSIFKDKKQKINIQGIKIINKIFEEDEMIPDKKVNSLFIKETPKKEVKIFQKDKLSIFKDRKQKINIQGIKIINKIFEEDEMIPDKKVNSLFIKETPKKEVKIFQKDKLSISMRSRSRPSSGKPSVSPHTL